MTDGHEHCRAIERDRDRLRTELAAARAEIARPKTGDQMQRDAVLISREYLAHLERNHDAAGAAP